MLRYLSDYKRESVLAPLFKMLEATFDLFVPLVMADIVNVGIAAHDFHYILVRCGILLLLAIVGLACSLTAQYFSAKAAVGYSTGLRHALFEHIQTLSFSEMDTMGTSTLITRMTSDVNQVQSGLNLFLRLFLRSPFVVIGAMIMAFTVNFRAALLFVVAIPLLSVVVFGVMVITRPLYKSVQTRLDRVLGLTRENLTGVRVVRAFDKEKSEVDRFEDANELLTTLEQENEILAYVDDSYTETQARALKSRLEAIPNVASVTFISRDEAMEDFKAQYPDEELFQDLDPEILEDRYAIKLVDLEAQSETVEAVQALTGISDVSHYEEIAGGFVTVRNVATVVCVALIAILFVVSVFIISNTIKLTTFDRREEIAIMKMCGATNGFIRWPFVVEGMILGLTGALVAFFIQWGLYEAVSRLILQTNGLSLITVLSYASMAGNIVLVFCGVGLVIGVGGSVVAIRKFLQV